MDSQVTERSEDTKLYYNYYLNSLTSPYSIPLSSLQKTNKVFLQEVMHIFQNSCFKLCLLIFFITFITSFSYEVDKITANNSISGDQTIVSSGGIFELGFFQPGKSSNYYIGIWYKKISLHTVVWVANRVNPMSDKHSYVLKLLKGNLVLTNWSSESTPIWSTNVSNTTKIQNPVHVVLLDSGNLVLRDGGNNTVWQSFDYPTDTWLDGIKIEYNKKTKQKTTLSSWKSEDDPAPSLFSFEIDAEQNQYVIMWNKTRQYWNSGPWDPQQQIFSLVPEMRKTFLYNFSYVNNENESYFTFNVYNPSLTSRFVIDTSGQIKTMTWFESSKQWNLFWAEPKQQCQVYAYCGSFGSCTQNSMPYCSCLKGFKPESSSDWELNDYSRGCIRGSGLECGIANSKKSKDRFLPYSDIALPENAQSLIATNLQDCELACLGNCSCNAFSYDNSGCSVWFGELLNLQQLSDGDPSGKTLYLKLAASEFQSKSKKKLIVGILGGLVVALTLVVVGLCLARRCRQNAQSSELKDSVEGSLIAFGYKELQTATKNFSEKLGGGGFGSVFKGTLTDSSVIAVKKLESFNQGEKQFRTEVSTIGTLQHVNLVRLRGFCSEGDKKLLVYDHMQNGSLDYHLFPGKNALTLDWTKRYQIALGTARGLAYLHEKCRDCIIHCDIKPENILLDAEFYPRVADFGLAKLVGRDFSRVLTTMRGTRGYLAPEWISGVAITAKADVFSYGMVLFELLSGHRNIEQSGDGTVKFFPTWAASKIVEVIKDVDILTILDPRLEGNADAPEVMKICKLACWCIQDNEHHRPSMGQVVQILEGVLDVNIPPIPKSLQVFVENDENLMFYTESSSGQSSQTKDSSVTSSLIKSSPSMVSG